MSSDRVLVLAFVILCLGACATTIPDTTLLEAVVMDGDRAATPGELALVTVQRGATRLETEPGMTLQRGDRIITGPRATAVIRWPSGSEAHLYPNSRVRIGSLFDLVGEVFVRIRGRFVIETEFMRAGAEGTSFVVRAVPSGEASVIVLDGRVIVSSLRGAWAPVRLAHGDKTITTDHAPTPLPDGKVPPPAAIRAPIITRARPDELHETQVRNTRIAKIAETSVAARRADPRRVAPDARRVTPVDPRKTAPDLDPRRVTPGADPRRDTPNPDRRGVTPDYDPRRVTPDADSTRAPR